MNFDSVIRVPCNIDNIFKYWLQFLTPFHHLTNREELVAAAYLKKRYYLSKEILNDELIDRALFSKEVNQELMKEYGFTKVTLQVVKTSLRAKKFLIDNRVNPKFIPSIKEENGVYKLLLVFEYEH